MASWEVFGDPELELDMLADETQCTGTWQGIWYLEFRAMKHTRKIVATIQGEKA